MAERPDRSLRVLFLCTRNSARSQLAEALLRDGAGGRGVFLQAADSLRHHIARFLEQPVSELDRSTAIDGEALRRPQKAASAE